MSDTRFEGAELTAEVVVRARQVAVENVEVAGLRAEERGVSAGAGRRRLVVGNPPPERSLRAAGKRARETTCERGRGGRRGSKRRRTADRLELVAEVLAAGLGRVEIRLDHLRRGAETRERGRGGRGASTRASSPCRCRGARRGRGAGGADSSLQSEGRRVRKSRGVGTVADQGEQNARIRDTPSSASRIGDGEPESRRPRARNAGRRQKRTWHALQQADVEVHPAGKRRARVSGGGGARVGGRRRRTRPTQRSRPRPWRTGARRSSASPTASAGSGC